MKWMRKHIFWIASVAVVGTVLWLVTTAVTLHSVQPESAGTLFGRNVSPSDHLKALQASMHQAILTHGDRVRKDVSAQELEEQAWERLLFLREAERKGIRASNQEVIREIQTALLFQREGQFDSAGYQTIMQYSLGTTPRIFEEETRDDLIIQKLIKQVIGTPSVTDKEIRERFQQRGGAMRIEFVTLPDARTAREIADACRQQPKQLERIAKQNNLKITVTDFFKNDESVPGLQNVGPLFGQMSNLQPGEAAGPFKSGTGWVVARLKERKPPEAKDLEAMRPDLEKELTARKRLQSYLTWYQDLMKRAKPQRKPLRPGR